MHTASVLALLATIAGVCCAAWQPMRDEPYIERIAHRFRVAGQKQIAGFEPIPDATEVEGAYGMSMKNAEGPGSLSVALLRTDAGIFGTVATPNGLTRLTPLAIRASCLVMTTDNVLFAVSPTAAETYSCTASLSKIECKLQQSLKVDFGIVEDCAAGAASEVLVAAVNGLFAVTPSGARNFINRPMNRVAYDSSSGHIFAGTNDDVSMLSSEGSLLRWEWVTKIETAQGGVYDGPVDAMVMDKDVLLVGNVLGVNARFPNGSVSRIDWSDGLPYNTTTALAVDERGDLWVGFAKGAARRDHATGDWQYFFGLRWLADEQSYVTGIAALPNSNWTVIATVQGASFLHAEEWTLAKKAAHYEEILKRHDRHGLVAECDLTSLGDVSTCTNHDSDNNGLWTSLVVAAEAFRYATTKSSDALAATRRYFNGMKLLNDITPITGLMARSAVMPGQSHQSGHWHNSTNPNYKGWQWKGDTSSDEVVGHLFAYPIVSRHCSQVKEDPTLGSEALQLLDEITTYIVKNGFYLIDVTGNHTTWGVWSPECLNVLREWSDERGLNALQILSFIASARNATGDKSGVFQAAHDKLTRNDVQYDQNMLNAKIETPDDDNYSDDELAFLPFYTYFQGAKASELGALCSSMLRSFRAIRPLRSNLWNTIYAATCDRVNHDMVQADIESILWNLRTWPVELIEWPVENSHRLDIWFNRDEDRFGRARDSSMRVLPANERDQMRWNGNPHELDGGSGMSEGDPGAWLLPYWMARFHGIIV
eukprot:m.12660 g.12660  ORF g.12660 m.12660 type:complete len:765 (-) comp3253_c0_seq1:54-2348(-)